MDLPADQGYFWTNLLRAAEVEPRDAASLRGSSGVDHPITAIGVDKRRRRVVVVSSEADPRTAAFIQSDLQLAIPDVKLIVARPEVFDRRSILAMYSTLPQITNAEVMAKTLTDSPAFSEVLTSIIKSVKMTSNSEFWKDSGLNMQTARAFVTLIISGLFQLVPFDKRPPDLSSITGIAAMITLTRWLGYVESPSTSLRKRTRKP